MRPPAMPMSASKTSAAVATRAWRTTRSSGSWVGSWRSNTRRASSSSAGPTTSMRARPRAAPRGSAAPARRPRARRAPSSLDRQREHDAADAAPSRSRRRTSGTARRWHRRVHAASRSRAKRARRVAHQVELGVARCSRAPLTCVLQRFEQHAALRVGQQRAVGLVAGQVARTQPTARSRAAATPSSALRSCVRERASATACAASQHVVEHRQPTAAAAARPAR